MAKQDWCAGQEVRCGFMRLLVKQKVPTPGDYRPDMYLMQDPKHLNRFYQFTPHYGLERLDATDLEAARLEIIGR
jgi:hypothetical protein